MFNKILVANRGEIACRIMRTCQRLGIRTVAVYSDADADALHVRMADEAVHVGGAASAQSYLQAERIATAAKATGAEAVHPGFGFLAENAAFAGLLASYGIVFVGPPVGAIAAMGDKIESKKLAIAAGVSTVPGHTESIPDAEQAARIAAGIGYPVMLKASAGGGGKGMRVAWSEADVREGFRAASSEARSSFGDDRVFIEKFIEEPRHIEIQVLADGHGNVVYLGERECSIQRRHQKVIEEAPSSFIDADTRRAMGEQAVALARAVDYVSAGTVEFIVDRDKRFYFLEMNTRLQVEHPVTEYVTGLDIVELMIRVGAGEKLPFSQDEVKLEGWAIEARVYAEDPARNFMPSTGRLSVYRPPGESRHVRVDAGVYEGAEISMYYDPMIAKLIAGGADREEARRRLIDALDAYAIRGVQHNIPFLTALLAHPDFAAGNISTAFIEQNYPQGFDPARVPHHAPTLLVAVAAVLTRIVEQSDAQISGQSAGPRKLNTHYVARANGDEYPLTLQSLDTHFEIEVGDQAYRIEGRWRPGSPAFVGHVNAKPFNVQIERRGLAWRLSHHGLVWTVQVLRPRAAELMRLMPVKAPPDLSRFLLSPMPGLLLSLAVGEGEEVKAGQELAVVEAMKMENVLRATQDATIAKLHARPGDNLEVDQAIIEFT
ncbi:MAG: acetyl/propionyl/methylcrotonyl-CoA carboxylase subunit alpha [Gammaproteobacteria bacterium]|nr:acetyl/propionyl/methylcrotonyl-CoA carboxylase subunit alpha [Gammaproteobacteria bacterium]